MACRFEYCAQHGLLAIHITGDLDDARIKAYYKTMSHCAEHLRPLAAVTHLVKVAKFSVNAEAVQELAWRAPAMPDPKRPRFIVAPSDHVFGMARMFQLLGENTRPRLYVVRHAEEAYHILGIHPPAFAPVSGFDHE